MSDMNRLARYELLPLRPDEIRNWDQLIAPFESRQLFHRSAWLSYLEDTQPVELRYWRIGDRGRTAGYFCGGLLRKGPFRILGSPLKGWGTNYLGPVVNGDFDQDAFLEALEELAVREKLSMIELENPVLDGEALARFGYQAVGQPTYLVELRPGDIGTMWKHFGKRSEVRQAIRFGVTVEETGDEEIAIEYYRELIGVFRRQGLPAPYPATSPLLLFRHLWPGGLLFALRAIGPDGSTVATGFFPHDERTLIFWGGACRSDAYKLRPNDLVHWKAMELAASSGLRIYNTSGDGLFKSKFGGTLHNARRWHKSYSWAAEWARSGYALVHQTRNRVRGWYQNRHNPAGQIPQ
jgi:hypothetical protein